MVIDLEKLLPALENLKGNLEDLNSAFPATQEFLKLKGVSNVRELNREGRRELTAYLEAELARISGKAKQS